jgi:hypothetical protein
VSIESERYTGTWKVVGAKVRKNGTGLDGLEVIVQRSDVC